jgi:hypothetical protein
LLASSPPMSNRQTTCFTRYRTMFRVRFAKLQLDYIFLGVWHMNNEESIQAFKDIVEVLRREGMDWMVIQVNDTIALGKPQTKKVKPFKESSGRPSYPASVHEQTDFTSMKELTGNETELTGTIDYTPTERLLILIDAVEQTIAETVDMEIFSISILERLATIQNQSITGINFISERDDVLSHQINNSSSSIRKSNIDHLRQLLRQVKADINDY